MKKVLFLIGVIILSLVSTGICETISKTSIGAVTSSGLTFHKKYTDGTVDANWSAGDPSATFTSAKSSTARGSYYDADGHIQVFSTANVGRFSYGYYDLTGWHPWDDGLPRFIYESDSSTNILSNGVGTFDANTAWNGNDLEYSSVKKWSFAEQDTFSSTEEIDTEDYIYNSSVKFTVDTTGSSISNSQFKTTGISIIDGTVYTLSFFVKSTKASSIYLFFNKSTSPFTSYSDEGMQTITLPENEWVRVRLTETANVTAADAQINITFGTLDVGTVLRFDCFQLEDRKSASTWIPSTSVADNVRPDETLTYSAVSNFAGLDNGTIIFKYIPVSLATEASGDYGTFFQMRIDSSNLLKIGFPTSASNCHQFFARSSNGNSDTIYSSLELVRFNPISFIWSYSITAVDGYKQNIYQSAIASKTNEDYSPPVGSIPSTFSIQSGKDMSIYLEEIAIFSSDVRTQGNAISNLYDVL